MIDPHALRTLIEPIARIETAMFQQAYHQRELGHGLVALHLERFAREIHAVLSALPETPAPTLLEKAVAARDERPWRFYHLERDVLLRMLDEQADRLRAIGAAPPPPSEEKA